MTDLLGGRVTVSVPASSANLGPGYDSLGLALDLRDEVTARVGDDSQVTVTGAGAGTVPLDENHLVHRAMMHTFAQVGCHVPGVVLHCENRIPHGRGLGSSSAAIVAGICAARGLLADGCTLVDDDQAFQLAAGLEGHPDNVAPALFGGFTIAVGAGDRFRVASVPVSSRVRAVLFVAPDAVETKRARAVLPRSVPHTAASRNVGRAALLVAALGGRPELLFAATEDELHQDHREPIMPDTLRLVRSLRAEAVPAVVSGAGPSVLALVDGSSIEGGAGLSQLTGRAPAGWRAEELAISRTGASVSMREEGEE